MPLINFLYPVCDFKTRQHVCDLNIYAICVLRSDKSVAGVQVLRVMHDGVNVLRLIEAISPDEWDDIKAAALSHTEGLYGKMPIDLTHTLYSIVQQSENKLS